MYIFLVNSRFAFDAVEMFGFSYSDLHISLKQQDSKDLNLVVSG